VCKYEGIIVDFPVEDSEYTLELKKNRYIDATCLRGIGAMANAKNEYNSCNAKFTTNRNRTEAYITSTKKINKGCEIFVHYGKKFKV
jgi:hypothetical protein